MPLSLHAMGRTMVLLLAFAACLTAHEPAKPTGAAGGPASSELPELPYRLVPDWLRLPPGWNLGETGGVATDARGHIYVFHRGPHPLLEFEPSGELVREIGAGLFVAAHGVEVDPQGNYLGGGCGRSHGAQVQSLGPGGDGAGEKGPGEERRRVLRPADRYRLRSQRRHLCHRRLRETHA